MTSRQQRKTTRVNYEELPIREVIIKKPSKKSIFPIEKKCLLRISSIDNKVNTTVFNFISGDSSKKYSVLYNKSKNTFNCNCGEQFGMTERTSCKHINSIKPLKDFFVGDNDTLNTDELADLLNKIL